MIELYCNFSAKYRVWAAKLRCAWPSFSIVIVPVSFRQRSLNVYKNAVISESVAVTYFWSVSRAASLWRGVYMRVSSNLWGNGSVWVHFHILLRSRSWAVLTEINRVEVRSMHTHMTCERIIIIWARTSSFWSCRYCCWYELWLVTRGLFELVESYWVRDNVINAVILGDVA